MSLKEQLQIVGKAHQMVSYDLTKAVGAHTGLKRKYQKLKQECLVLYIENESLRKATRNT